MIFSLDSRSKAGSPGLPVGNHGQPPFTYQVADLRPMPRLPSPRVPQMCMGVVRVTVWRLFAFEGVGVVGGVGCVVAG